MDTSELDWTSGLAAEWFGETQGNLRIGAYSAEELVERFGSPLYAFDAEKLRARATTVRSALGERTQVLFALKSNPNAAVCRLLHRAGCGAELASAGELHVALAAGVPGAEMCFAGPGKSVVDLEAALEHGVGCLNLESVAEYEALAALVAQRGGEAPTVALRVNLPRGVKGARMKMGGGKQKFGIDIEDLPGMIRRITDEGAVRVAGLHVYAGTQCFDAEGWVGNAQALVELADRLESETGAPLRKLNFGGGFGVPVHEGDELFDLKAAGEGLQGLIEADGRSDRDYVVELGRYLVAPAGAYLTRVQYLKTTKGRQHAILDGGMHHHAAAAGVGAIIKRPFPVLAVDRIDAPRSEKYALGGPLCTPADELGAGVDLPPLAPGDVLAFLSSGAYGLTFSQSMFLSHPTPAEVLVDGERADVVRERGRPEDALRGQSLPVE